MDHVAVIRQSSRMFMTTLVLAVLSLLLMPVMASAAGATPVAPQDGHHFDYLDLAPMVQFDPSNDANGKQEQPRWVILATDAEMKNTVRYCRYFVWASTDGAYHWGCNRWATGVDQLGQDQLLALEAGKVYYWQVVSASNAKDENGKPLADVVSSVQSFAIDAKKDEPSIGDVSNQIFGTAFDDGTQLNLGAAAFVNSKVRVKKIHSTRMKTFVLRVHVEHLGTIDARRSYIKVTSKAGTRYLKVRSNGKGKVWATWVLNKNERGLKTRKFTYQAFLKSAVNGAMVRSPYRVVLIKTKPKPPAWKPDNSRR